MLHGLKRIFFGQPDHTYTPTGLTDEDLAGASLEELVDHSLTLGATIDELRERRRKVKTHIDARIAERDAKKD